MPEPKEIRKAKKNTFNHRDAVDARTADGEIISGHVVGLHQDGRVDVRFDQAGHGLHGYTRTFALEDVAAREPREEV